MTIQPVPVGMVDRISLIMGAFEGDAVLSLSEVVAATDLPRSSVHRFLQQLVGARWLERVENEYRLGLGIFEIGTLVAHRNRILAQARPYLQQLSISGDVVAHLAVLDGKDVVYLEKMGGAFAARLPSRVGGRMTATCTGVGKALLAFLPREELVSVLEQKLETRTSRSITDPHSLSVELARVRSEGVAYDRGEAVPGLACVATPVLRQGKVVAAISVSGAAAHLNAASIRHSLKDAAARISRQLSVTA